MKFKILVFTLVSLLFSCEAKPTDPVFPKEAKKDEIKQVFIYDEIGDTSLEGRKYLVNDKRNEIFDLTKSIIDSTDLKKRDKMDYGVDYVLSFSFNSSADISIVVTSNIFLISGNDLAFPFEVSKDEEVWGKPNEDDLTKLNQLKDEALKTATEEKQVLKILF